MTNEELAVLKAFKANEEADPEGMWACFHHSIIKATRGSFDTADAVCRNLRRRKLLAGEGKGKMASYYITDKGKEALTS